MEGTHCFSPATGCSTAGLTLPVFDYDHTQGDDTVIGGHIYRGTKMPSLVGSMFSAISLADECGRSPKLDQH